MYSFDTMEARKPSEMFKEVSLGEKDITEKILADYNDVFADIVNVLLFHGRQVVSADDLETVKDRSQYKMDGKIHEQERDVSKVLKKGNTTITLVGFEHQTKAEKFMPVRQIGYDGQAYRSQILQKDASRIYPVITMVLYFGTDEHWEYSHHLKDLMDIPEGFEPFVSDYEMKNLYEIAFLTPEQVKLFRSDFRYVADYLVQKRMTNDYKPSADQLNHVDETLKLMTVLSGDRRFEDVVQDLPAEGGVSMCEVLDRVENKGREEGKIEGMTQIYYTKLHYSADQIAEELNAPVDRIQKLIQQIVSESGKENE